MKVGGLLKRQNGLTFVELLFVLLVISFIIITVLITINTSIRSMQANQVTITDIRQARSALNRIVQEINFAARNTNFVIVADASNPGSSVLNYVSQISGVNTNCSIFLNNGVVFLRQGSNPPIPLTNQNVRSVQTLSFQINPEDPTQNTVDIDIRLSNNKEYSSSARKLNYDK